MSRRPSGPWFNTTKQAYYVTINGRQTCLGRDKQAAEQKFHRLMAGHTPPAADAGSQLAFGDLLRLYLDSIGTRVTKRTLYVARGYLQPFVDALGALPVSAVRPFHIEQVIRPRTQRYVRGRVAREAWSPSTEHHVKCRVMAAFNWAVRQGIIDRRPFAVLDKPRAGSRGAETVVSNATHARLMDAAPEYLRDILLALHDTGARPGEVLRVTAGDTDATRGVWIIRQHKSAEKTGRPRVVRLSDRLRLLCERLAARYPTGPLFRSARGKSFDVEEVGTYYLSRLLRLLCKRLRIVPAVTPYHYRHTFATRALTNNVHEAKVAELLGHTGTTMLHKHYSHLTVDDVALREALDKALGGAA